MHNSIIYSTDSRRVPVGLLLPLLTSKPVPDFFILDKFDLYRFSILLRGFYFFFSISRLFPLFSCVSLVSLSLLFSLSLPSLTLPRPSGRSPFCGAPIWWRWVTTTEPSSSKSAPKTPQSPWITPEKSSGVT